MKRHRILTIIGLVGLLMALLSFSLSSSKTVEENISQIHITDDGLYSWTQNNWDVVFASELPRIYDSYVVAAEVGGAWPGLKRLGEGHMAQLGYIVSFLDEALIAQLTKGTLPSIVLAQGILESDALRSRLYRVAGAHFGIKCWDKSHQKTRKHLDHCVPWHDDSPKDRFIRFDSAEENYNAHGDFLHRDNYAELWKPGNYDYKTWAKILQKRHYATGSSYANKLISIIERYDLSRFDHLSLEDTYVLLWTIRNCQNEVCYE